MMRHTLHGEHRKPQPDAVSNALWLLQAKSGSLLVAGASVHK